MNNKYKVIKNKYGFFQISPTPSEEEITKFYAEEFYTGEYKNFNDSSLEVQLNDKEFFQGRWQDIYENFVEINDKFKNNADILDVGCGWGLALQFFKEGSNKEIYQKSVLEINLGIILSEFDKEKACILLIKSIETMQKDEISIYRTTEIDKRIKIGKNILN